MSAEVPAEGAAPGARETPSRRVDVAVGVATVGLLVLFYLVTMREGHLWGGDFAQYLIHARNLVEGRPYVDSGLIPNPRWVSFAPPAYPPVLPLLLAPAWAGFGLELEPIKRLMLLPYAGFFAAFFAWVHRREGPFAAALVVVLVGLNPYLWRYKENVLSDVPFLALLFAAFLLVDRLDGPERSKLRSAATSVGLGVVCYLAYGTRALGIALLPALLVYDAIRFRRLRWTSVTACATALLFVVVQELALATTATYVGKGLGRDFPWGLASNVVRNALLTPLRFGTFFRGSLPGALENAGIAWLFAVGVAGAVTSLRREITIYEVFLAFCLCATWLYPFGVSRYALPILPLFVFYLYRAVRAPKRPVVRTLVASLSAVAIASLYGAADWGPIDDGVHTDSARGLFAFAREKTPEGSVFVFFKPRVLYLYTGRPAAVYGSRTGPEAMRRFVGRIGARYLVANRKGAYGSSREDDALWRLVDAHRAELALVYDDAEFSVFETPEAWRR